MPHQGGKPDWSGGNPGLNPGRGGGGRPDGAGSKKGDLFGDQLVLYRDLDPADGGGNGEAVLDGNGQIIPVGYDPAMILGGADGLFPIYFTADAEGDYEIPPELLPYAQEVELERANVARAPAKVQEKALEEALGKVLSADVVDTDPAGRIIYSTDGGVTFSTIDAPLENLALYQYLMTDPGGAPGAWPDVTAHWDQVFLDLLGDPVATDGYTDPAWDPSALLGAAWSKEGKITLDAMLYENTTLGINQVEQTASGVDVTYFDFSAPAENGTPGELYDYDRAETYGDTWLRWIEIVNDQPVFRYGTVFDAVFGGQDWLDEYLQLDDGGTADPSDDEFVFVGAPDSGVNDFAAAADDSRAVIEFMHTFQAVEVAEADVPAGALTGAETASVSFASTTLGAVLPDEPADHEAETVMGTNRADVIETGGGPQEIHGLNGADVVRAGGGPDKVFGGNAGDSLFGGGGPDEIDGGNGPDMIVGGHGLDILTGGNGPDSFVFLSPQDAPAHGAEGEGPRETITDFKPGVDTMDLTALGLQGFGPAPAAWHVWAVQEGADTAIHVDTDGDVTGEHPAEMEILLLGVDASTLSLDDFLL